MRRRVAASTGAPLGRGRHLGGHLPELRRLPEVSVRTTVGMLPDFLIIGAPKAGTTSLHRYLSEHPDIWMPPVKELHFFGRGDWRDHLDWYASQFGGGARLNGEASTSYAMHPFVSGVPERIRSVMPRARLVYLVRDPVDRLISHYVEWVWRRFEQRPLRKALADLEDPANPYVCSSMYAMQLERYLRSFDSAQLLVLDADDLLRDRERAVGEALTFVGLASRPPSLDLRPTLNRRRDKLRPNRVGRWLIRSRLLSPPAPRSDEPAPPPLVRRLTMKPIEAPLDDDLRERLLERFRPDVERLRELTGRPLAGWSL